MTKKLLLAGIALGALTFAGAASAHTLTYRTGAPVVAGALNPIGSAAAQGPGAAGTNPYLLAEESRDNLSGNDRRGTFLLQDVLTTGSSLPSGNVRLTVTLEGATFGSSFSGASISGIGGTGAGQPCAGFTSALSSGGQAGDSTAVFVISNSVATCTGYTLDVPFLLGTSDTIRVRTDLTTDSSPGTPLDPPQGNFVALSTVDAFQWQTSVTDGSPTADLRATNGAYTNFTATPANQGDLGDVRLLVDTDAHVNLADLQAVPAHVVEGTFRLVGNNTAFANIEPVGAQAAEVRPFTNNSLEIFPTLTGAGNVTYAGTTWYEVDVDPIGNVAIPVSDYEGCFNYTLAAVAGGGVFNECDDLAPIIRNGTNVVLPWMNSRGFASRNSGAPNNAVRLGNLTNTPAQVFAQVLSSNSSGSSYVRDTMPTPVGILPANGELSLNRVVLSDALGDFGQGDVQISIEALPNTVTVRRLQLSPSGSWTEITSGTVAQEQNYSFPSPSANPPAN